MTNSKVKVAVGMSGGVDSSVAAYLLIESGYEVKGIFMKNWEEDDSDECSSKEDYEDARRVCKHLGIELNLVNFSDKYWTNVFETFINELKKGFTPNPDIFCNREIKFKQYYDYALSLNFDLIHFEPDFQNQFLIDSRLQVVKRLHSILFYRLLDHSYDSKN